ncbi:MAG: MFS transporter, partial [Devosia sp.]
INSFGWPAVFGLMAAAGTGAFAICYYAFPPDLTTRRNVVASFDILGMLLLTLSLGAYALASTLGAATSGLVGAGLVAVSVITRALFVAVERRANEPLVQLTSLRNRALTAGLVSIGLISTVMMATLVVGPFYLTGVLGLGPVETGLAMSVGPIVAALIGVPAGRLVERLGETTVTKVGLFGVTGGSVLMLLLPGAFGISGYLAGLTIITAGYALFQAANNTTVMKTASAERRGVTSALLGLSRNLGLITGASAMGAVFAFGSQGVELLGLGAGGEAGLRLTFAIGGLLTGAALATSFRASNRVIHEPVLAKVAQSLRRTR